MVLSTLLGRAFQTWDRSASKKTEEFTQTIKTAIRLLDELMSLDDLVEVIPTIIRRIVERVNGPDPPKNPQLGI